MNRRGLIIGASALAASRVLAAPALVQSDIMIGRGRYGSPCDGVNSDSDAIDLAVQDIRDGGANPGTVRIHLPTEIAITRNLPRLGGIRIIGQGAVETHVRVRGPISGTPGGRYLFDFSTSASGRYGGGLEGLSIEQSEFTGGVTLVALNVPPGGTPPANTRFCDLRLGAAPLGGSPASWLAWRCLQFLGRTDTIPIGMRSLVFARIQAFGVSQLDTIWIDQAHSAVFEDISAFPTAPVSGGGGRATILNSQTSSGRGLNFQGTYQLSGNAGSSFVGVGGTLL